ncbi:hypothetical protein RS84_00182 [Microbacterium hydrocarbonoxydans]|uniref:DUF4190 domain-containing protein n=1 Tax=Microbacterium hydrocarbonoxydans TaxID=273678 RepID=A0A0M2HX16_9MICO|nr:DUF4190 domain-containing protein [Microbacterium hydrocarbonoxydans]KJL49470.1 hypothetical protein RS84_00182 [Microbacterium hydrocarbonoxydans]
MTDPSRPEDHNPYAPPPAGEPVMPPVPAPQDAPPAYQPPAAQPPLTPGVQPPAAQPPQYPGAAYPGAPVAGPQSTPPAAKNSAKTSSIISLVAGIVSIFLIPYIAGIVGIGTGVTAIRMNNAAKNSGAGFNSAYTGMAIGGIVLGAIGIVLKLVLDIALR